MNQIELHPWLQQEELRSLHRKLGITTEGVEPAGPRPGPGGPGGPGARCAHGRTAAQIVLRWQVQLGNTVIPKASSYAAPGKPGRLGFILDAADLKALAGLERGSAPARTRQRQLGSERMEHVDTVPSPTPLFSAALAARTRAPPWTSTAAAWPPELRTRPGDPQHPDDPGDPRFPR